ncbi:hypothetical protein LTS07_011158 [Exophiala sideris]|uniref:JmjC domain-containing protein n=1 Tax=Exophiala sideris TaxID=1016849 RepID=A0ABR0IVM4_9EURO|nr:hypothetical protein LTS07_011158 [Exophiala sideris]KAK5030188.1 hypothetical protein LTR13_008206 [Exophiala sideris]KAK5049154.1 hypothetical protein LTR69_011181 [Exophiala sideris]KAK5176418.1 hypothetical protein LTR44_011040 [Eurotiomycetes sp. CCFEE 6388]
MASVEVKLETIEEGIKVVKKMIDTYPSPHTRRKNEFRGPQKEWLDTVTTLMLQLSTDFQDLKAECRRRLSDGGIIGQIHSYGGRRSVEEGQTQATKTYLETGQQLNHGISAFLDTVQGSASTGTDIQSEDMIQDDCRQGFAATSTPPYTSMDSPSTSTAVNQFSNSATSISEESDVSEASHSVQSTTAPPFEEPPTLSLSTEQMGPSLVENVMRLTGKNQFSGIVSIENPPHFEWATFRESMGRPKKGHDFYGVEYSDVGVPGAVGLRVSNEKALEYPEFRHLSVQHSRADGEAFICAVVGDPPLGPIQYYVGPSLARTQPASDYDSLLHPGLQLLQSKLIPGVNEAYWHLGQKGSGTGFHKEDAEFLSMNLVASGWKVWIRIVIKHTAKFEAFVKKGWRCNDCDQFVRHQNLLISPATLRLEGIGFEIDCVGPRQMVVTEAGQYHAVLNMTDCFAVSINFLPTSDVMFQKTLRVCQDCGLYPLDGANFIRVSPTPAAASHTPLTKTSVTRKRHSADNSKSAPVRETKRITNIHTRAVSDFTEVMVRMKRIDKLCRFPSLECGATSEVFELVTAIMSPAAIVQFHHLVTSLREVGTSIIHLDVSSDSSTRLVQHIRKIDTSGRRSILERFIVRIHQLLLAEEVDNRDDDGSRLRAKASVIKLALARTKWDRSKLDYNLKQGRLWKRICGDLRGLLGFIFLEASNPFNISLDRYRCLKNDDFEMFHRLLRNEYITAICTAGYAFQKTLQTTTADVEFLWETENLALGKASEADLLRLVQQFPTPSENVYTPEKYSKWPQPEGWPEDWSWPCDPTWVPPERIKCDLCGKKTICDCINFPPRPMPRIKYYDGKGRGLRAVASTPGVCAYKKGETIDKLIGELVPIDTQFKDGWCLELKRPDLVDEPAVCHIYCGLCGNTVRLVNHACKPSAEFKTRQISGKIWVVLVAKKDILDGEEITANCGRGFIKKGECRCNTCVQST